MQRRRESSASPGRRRRLAPPPRPTSPSAAPSTHRDPRRRPGARRRDQLPPLRARGSELLEGAAFTFTKPVAGNGTYTSANFTPTRAGTYRWIADDSGDSDNAPTSGRCITAGESVVVAKATPTLSTDASANVALGGSVHDTATLAGGSAPSGEISFRLYGPGDDDCSGQPAFTSQSRSPATATMPPPPSPRPPPAPTAGPPITRVIQTTRPRALPATPPASR